MGAEPFRQALDPVASGESASVDQLAVIGEGVESIRLRMRSSPASSI